VNAFTFEKSDMAASFLRRRGLRGEIDEGRVILRAQGFE
jgi:hypothetical protein